jgi:hypothetical protein
MPQACPICGDEIESEGDHDDFHFGSDDDGDQVEVVCLFIEGARKDRLACGGDPDTSTWSPEREDVNCSRCLATM